MGVRSSDAVKTNCSDAGMQESFPLTGIPLAITLDPEPVVSRYAFNDTLTGRTDPSSPIYHGTWALSGA